MSHFQVPLLALFLVLAGGSLFLYKYRVLGFPVQPDAETRVWTVEAMVNLNAGPGPVKASLHIPGLTPGFAILDENFVSRGFGFNPRYVRGGREVEWHIRRARGPQTLYYRAIVYREPEQRETDTTPPFPPKPELGEPFNTAMEVLVDELRSQSADPASYTVELLKRLADGRSDQNVELLLGPAASLLDRARTATTLLAAARIPARLVRGIILQDRQRKAVLVPWLEIHDGRGWTYFDPETGSQGLPDNFLLWWSGTDPLVEIEGARDVDVKFSVQSNVTDPVVIAQRKAERKRAGLASFSIFDLPIQTQAVYAILLLVPVGALVVIVLRNIIGVQTFGTFMPVLIALAFRETQLLWGVLLFSVLVALGLAFRFLLERLRLLLVPRLGAVLIIVVLLMLMTSMLSHQLGFEIGLSVALFPMVILAMTIERMSVVWEERGSREAIQQGLGSLLVAMICYLVMGLSYAEHLVFVFPELLLVVLAVTLLIGRYTGYRLVELYRFRDIRQSNG